MMSNEIRTSSYILATIQPRMLVKVYLKEAIPLAHTGAFMSFLSRLHATLRTRTEMGLLNNKTDFGDLLSPESW